MPPLPARIAAALLAATLLAAPLPARALAGCRPTEGDRLVLASTPAAQALIGAGPGILPTVLVQVNGAALPFALDTGSALTLLRPEAAAALGLPPDPGRTTAVTGIGGRSRRPNALLRHLRLGRREYANLSLPVAPGGEEAGRLAGIIGADLLRHATLEIDLPAGRITLHDGPACLTAPPPWSAGEPITLEVTPEGLAILAVTLNGRPARALLDTGAARTVLRRDRISEYGIAADLLRTPPAGTVYGTGDETAAFHVQPGATLRLGARDTATLPIVIAPLPDSLPVDLILGQDILAPRRLWLSLAARRLHLGASAGPRS